VQVVLVAGCRFGDTVHPPVKFAILFVPVSSLIRVDTLIVQLLHGHQPCSPSRPRSGGVLLHSGPSQICLSEQALAFACKVNGFLFAFAFATVMMLFRLHGHFASH
jgi:hypothetical protein